MRNLLLLTIHLIVTVAKLMRRSGTRSVIAESMLLKHQLLIDNRTRQCAPNLSALDRVILGLTAIFVAPHRFSRLGLVIKPSTLLRFHRALIERKYRWIFSSVSGRRKPGPKGPAPEVVAAIIALKQRNPRFGCVRIAQQISLTFGLAIDKDVVRRVLAKHYRPESSGSAGPSWLTLMAQSKDSLWSIDLFRCQSILLRSRWVLVVMDVCTRRIAGFGISGEFIDGTSVCRMFNQAIAGQSLPKYLSTDNDPLFRFHQWQANLRIREIEEIKSIPYVPVSHPFVERLIGTIRRELLDQVFFWNTVDLGRKLAEFKDYYNSARLHRGLDGATPALRAGLSAADRATLSQYGWKQHCRGLFQTPVAA